MPRPQAVTVPRQVTILGNPTPPSPAKELELNRRRRAEMWSRANNTTGRSKQIVGSVRRGCARSAVRFRIHNCAKAALRLSVKTSLLHARRVHDGASAAKPADRLSKLENTTGASWVATVRGRLLEVLRSGRTMSRGEAVQAGRGARLLPPLWLLLAGVIALGIFIGLFAASITVILLSGFGALAAEYVDVRAPPAARATSLSVLLSCSVRKLSHSVFNQATAIVARHARPT
jgi:hypothetical protein